MSVVISDKEKDIQIALGTYLPLKWKERDELWAEGSKLCAEGSKLCAEGNKLWKKGNKLWTEGDKLRAEGRKLYANAVIEIYGPKAIINWDTGEVKV